MLVNPGVARRARSAVIQIGPPFGVTVLDLPLRMPLPAKITIDVLPPIHLLDELG